MFFGPPVFSTPKRTSIRLAVFARLGRVIDRLQTDKQTPELSTAIARVTCIRCGLITTCDFVLDLRSDLRFGRKRAMCLAEGL